MFYKISDFRNDWAIESEATLKILNSLSDESLNQKVCDDGRTLGRIAWHIVGSLSEMAVHAGLPAKSLPEDLEMPSSSKMIAEEYEKSAKELVEIVTKLWSDESLIEEIPMYGDRWQKGYVLTVLVRHQIHHRAQMTVLMRQAGLKVPGVYGPSREEWVLMNLRPKL
jgi:uncharacterized damage-inducible protein DinB